MVGVIVSTLLLCGCGIASRDKPQLPIGDHRDAISAANQFSGFDKLPYFSDVIITVQQVVIEEDKTVLSGWIEGRLFWKVSYANVVLPKTSIAEPLDKIHAFDVLVDVKTGQAPKLVSQWLPNSRYKAPILRYKEKIRPHLHSLRKKRKQYTIPEVSPKISFLQLYRDGLCGPDDEHIEVVYMWGWDDVLVPTLFFNRYGRGLIGVSVPARCCWRTQIKRLKPKNGVFWSVKAFSSSASR